MKSRKLIFWCCLVIIFMVTYLLLSGSSFLLRSTFNTSIPIGTPITWLLMISLPLSIYLGVYEMRTPSTNFYITLSIILKTVLVLGILWVPLSYLLSGNFSFTFTEKASFQGGQKAMKLFWVLTYCIPAGSVLVLISYWISLLFKKKS